MKKLLFSLGVGAVVFAGDWELEAPTGLKFGLIKGYENWHVVATHYRTDKNELRYIIGNDKAVEAYLKGAKKFPDGAILVKIGYSLKKNPAFPASVEPDAIQRIEYMLKDSKRFKDSAGWGFARFVKDQKTGKYKVFGKSARDYMQCFSCHQSVANKDYVFTDYVKRK
ncbi:cytochrome P460 family protein [Hydrogenivirga sp. 128-5-R1-1]|uniref:cytochrome P460 family protein n=1 Tax=Hydrogenivirga sp. 128-5-R1-1 TaxID=392423 RepID=UPI00015EF1E7|nr:cytochrome P460 family protein [Hydrogenivirga sp. 128-5-R1-1]EDP74704.1 cytochrome p460, putative [Hydrogenivirga sp. 128-5-R1-1]